MFWTCMLMMNLAAEPVPPPRPLALWYERPAGRWMEALPVGNGRLGAMVWGGRPETRISLNETTFWAGEAQDDNVKPGGAEALPKVRRLLFSGQFTEARELLDHFEGRKGNYGTNLPAGELVLTFDEPGDPIEDYRRTLDLDTAVATVTYSAGWTRYTREVFASHPAGVIVVRLEAGKPGALAFTLGYDGGKEPISARAAGPDVLVLDGHAYEDVHSDGHTGVRLHGMVRVMADGAECAAKDGAVAVKNATTATLLIALATDFGGRDPEAACRARIDAAGQQPYDALRAAHICDHQALFRRVAFDLGPAKAVDRPTDDWLEMVQEGLEDPALAALYFQYARYLMMGASRADSPLPMHLQGVWNDGQACRMAWTCDYHLDINEQMNYWIAEPGNLAECHLPLFRWIQDILVPSGEHTARTLYGCRGWAAHTVSNAWGYSAPGWGRGWGLHPTGGAWIAAHLWDHYEFNPDGQFLRDTALPVMHGAAWFFLDYLAPHPERPWLVSGPATSPENAFRAPRQGRFSVSMGPTCDHVLIRDVFAHCLEACAELDCDADFIDWVRQAKDKLPPFMVGERAQLQEWLEDYPEAVPQHRHTSHLIAVYPSDQITPHDTPDLARAAKTTVARRLSARGWESTGWSQSNMTAFLARLGHGDEAHGALMALLRRNVDENLLSYHPPLAGAGANIFEIDGNFGGAAAMCEMVLQSHRGVIHLLPAVPTAWGAGQVRGLRARGGYTVDVSWSGGRLERARIHATRQATCRIRCADPIDVAFEGAPVRLIQPDPKQPVYAFAAKAGGVYEISRRRSG